LPNHYKNRVSDHFSAASICYASKAVLQNYVSDKLFSFFCEYVANPSLIIDLGCGDGRFSSAVRNKYPQAEVVNLDISYGMCLQSSKKQSSEKSYTVNADAEYLPFRDAAFDALFSSLMIQWLGDPAICFEQIHNVVKSGGRIAISTFLDGTLSELSRALLHATGKPRVLEFKTMQFMENICAQSGFTVLCAESEIRTERYTDMYDLLKEMRVIGAKSKATAMDGFVGKQSFQRAAEYYSQNFSDNHPGNHSGNGDNDDGKKIVATWHIGYLVIQKL
jgi:malonyl-CoA O-methyltransferase